MSSNACLSTLPPDLVDRLRSAKAVTVLTGSGVSAESGVPTFRDAQTGLWSQFQPEELATPNAFLRQPQLVWDWYVWRRELIGQALPNAGHRALVEMEERVPQFTLITQNVDGLHQRAGSRRVIELHGSILRTKCFDEEIPVDVLPDTDARPPRCPRCGAYIRPDVVWFGEMLPREALDAAFVASRACDVFLSVGTSTLVEPAASLPFGARGGGAAVVEVNPNPTPLSERADFVLRGSAADLLPLLARVLHEEGRSQAHRQS